MTFNIGDEFVNASTGTIYRIASISNYGTFIRWDQKYENDWILVMMPTATDDLIRDIKLNRVYPNTEAGRLFYDKKN